MQVSDEVTYRCFAGHFCKATVIEVRGPKMVDLAVDTGTSEPLKLTKVRVVTGIIGNKLKTGECTPDKVL